MYNKNDQKKIIATKEYNKIHIGMATILLSPILGSLLFYIYVNFVGSLISTVSASEIFWFSCILSVAILGIAMVIVGCTEKSLKDENTLVK